MERTKAKPMFYTWKELSENGNHKAALHDEKEMLNFCQNQNSISFTYEIVKLSLAKI